MTFKKTLLAASLAAMSMAAVAQTNDASKDGAETEKMGAATGSHTISKNVKKTPSRIGAGYWAN